jgi:topoisomerase IV subunit A
MPKLKDTLDTFVETLLKESFEDILADRFGRYSKYIIQDRALPDARDGLKPVQRRILYAMQQLGMTSTQPYKKSARIAGEVMGKYHPHGDSSIYEAMVRLSQDFKMHMPLIDMHGNNGSIDGDSAAAMRYTEARLSKAAELLLQDINSRTVPLVPNFDDEEVEPTVLPAKFPNLLVNGATGISAGYATKIPPHNIHEVISATIALIKNDQLTTQDLMKYIKGPDFPTGGLVQGIDGIYQALDTGAGKVVLRASYHIEEIKNDQQRIVIDEIPYEVNKADLVKNIDALRVNKKLDDLFEIRDESDQEGLRIAIDLKKGRNPDLSINYLFKHTDLQVNYHYNMVAILNHRPEQVGIIPILKTYIYHQKDVVTNKTNYDLKRASIRLHIVEGLIRMVSVINEIIAIIRASKNKQDAKDNIIEKFAFSSEQAEAIVTLQLYRLSNTDITSLQTESKELQEKIDYYHSILNSDEKLSEVIISELEDTSKLIGLKRRSIIEEHVETIKIDEKDLIVEENVMIGFTRDGYLKRSNLKSFQLSTQAGLKSEDTLIFQEELTTLHHLIIFTNLGNFAFIPVYKIDDQKWKDLGIYINNIVPFEEGEMAIKIFAFKTFKTNKTFVLVTTQGQIKHVTLDQFEMIRYQKTTRCMVLDEGDILADVSLAMQHYISVMTKNGMMLNMSRDDVPYYGLSARGVKAIKLSDDDYVTAVTTFNVEDDLHMVSSRGHLITLKAAELPLSKRFRKGFTAIEEVKSQPHIIHYMKATPQTIKDDVMLQSFSDQTSIKEPLKSLIAKENKFGKPLFKGKKEIHLQTYIYYEENDTYQQIVKDPQTNEALSTHDKIIEETMPSKNETITTDVITNIDSPEKKEHTKKKTSLNEEVADAFLEKDIPKKTENIQRLSLFDDEDI